MAIVDDEDLKNLQQFSWARVDDDRTSYAVTNLPDGNGGQITSVALHRIIMGCRRGDGLIVDHINRNGLDNRKTNLRKCTKTQSSFNRGKKRGSRSPFKGVSWLPHANKWRARIQVEGKRKLIGDFITEKDAALAYDKEARRLHGDFAVLNFPVEN